jgi:predicted permease
MLMGFAAARLGLFSVAACEGLTRFVFNFALPVMLFRVLAHASLPTKIPWDHLLSYYGAALATIVCGMAVGRIIGGRGFAGQSIVGLAAGFANTVLIGIPLVQTTFGDEALLPALLIVAFHSVVLITAGTVLLELSSGNRKDLRRLPLNTAKSFATNPIIIGILAGAIFALAEIPIPKPADNMASLLGQAAAPCALFAMGATLNQYRIAGNIGESLAVTTLKLALHPFLVWLLATQVLNVDTLSWKVAVILAATPTGANVFILAARYRTGIATTTTSILVSTALSLVGLSIVLLLLGVR